MTTFLNIRLRLFFLLVLFFVIALMVQSFVLLSLTSSHTGESVRLQTEVVLNQLENGTAEELRAGLQQLKTAPWLARNTRLHRWLALAFVVANALILGVVLFFRIDRSFVRPLERVGQLAEQYTDDTLLYSAGMEENHPYRALSQRLRLMLERIESDRQRLQKQVAELERVNAELVASRAQLVRSEKLAMVGQLSAGLAHEIGNPLAIVGGYLDILKEEDVAAEDRTLFVDNSRMELDRVGRLISELLQFSRTDSPQEVELVVGDFLRECAELASMHAAVRRCNLVVDAGGDDFAGFLGSADLLRQVILNCVLNAADALEEAGREDGEIVLRAAIRGGERGRVLHFAVQDNGPGVSAEVAARMFEPFFTTKEAGKGTGLGLFVCQMLVGRMGGEVVAENVEGGFCVRWELAC